MPKKTTRHKKVSKPKPRAKAKKSAPKHKAAKGKPATLIVVSPQKKKVGHIIHYYNKIGVGIIKLADGELAVGDEISIEGSHTKIKQKVNSMQYMHKAVNLARKGQEVGLKVSDRVRKRDAVYKIVKKI